MKTPIPHQPAQPETAPATAHTWKVMPDPINAGKHPFHDARWIATADAEVEFGHDPRNWGLTRGSLICEMRDLPNLPQVAAQIASLPALISERDRLRDALEKTDVVGYIAMRGATMKAENTVLGADIYDESDFKKIFADRKRIEEALANTAPSESTCLREINAALVGTLGNVRAFMSSGIPSSDESELLDEIEAALKKAKDAQG